MPEPLDEFELLEELELFEDELDGLLPELELEELLKLPEEDEPEVPPVDELLDDDELELLVELLSCAADGPVSVVSLLQPISTARKTAIITGLMFGMIPPSISIAGTKQIAYLRRNLSLPRANELFSYYLIVPLTQGMSAILTTKVFKAPLGEL